LAPYQDSAGKLTIGYGRNLDDNGISEKEAEILLEHDLAAASQDIVSVFPEFETYSESRKTALADMMFNLGRPRLLGFTNMISAVKSGDWKLAGAEMLDSRWATQVGPRARKLAESVRTG
jgi:lysozyme